MNRDLVAGLALIVAGAAYAAYASAYMPLGTLRQMGPGMFPMGLGVLLAIFGAVILVPAFVQRAEIPKVNPRALLAVTASVVVFAILIRRVGLLPSVVVTTLVASLAIPGRRPLLILVLCIALAALTWLIFVQLLNLTVPVIRWRF